MHPFLIKHEIDSLTPIIVSEGYNLYLYYHFLIQYLPSVGLVGLVVVEGDSDPRTSI